MLRRYVEIILGTAHKSSSEAERVKGRWFEMLSVVCLAVAAIMLLLPLWPSVRVLSCVALLALAWFFYTRAAEHSFRAAREEEDSSSKVMYRITPARLVTLRHSGVARDVLAALKELEGAPAMNQDEFYARMVYDLDLGVTRADEFKATIFKYTKVYAPPEGAPKERVAAEGHADSAATPVGAANG